MSLRPGTEVRVEALNNARFSVWSPADEGPGAYFVVPVDPGSPYKFAVIRATFHAYAVDPAIELLRTEAKET